MKAADQLRISDGDPTGRTRFIQYFPAWPIDLTHLCRSLRQMTDPDIRSGLCMALGGIDFASRSAAEKQLLRDEMWHWYQKAPDSGTHSAAGWALRQWKLTPPKLKPSAPQVADERPLKDHPWYVNSLAMKIVGIPADVYRISSKEDPDNQPRKEPVKGFWVSDCEVTVEQFRTLVPQAKGPQTESDSLTPLDLRKPVIYVTWYDAVEFCNRLSEKERLHPYYRLENEKRDEKSGRITEAVVVPGNGNGYRLPKEVEWEIACRASTTTEYSFGENDSDLPDYAWFTNNSSGKAHPVAEKRPNAWGLHDMHGNVFEWCEDRYYEEGVSRVFRGGCWDFSAESCRSSYRFRYEPAYRYDDLGFRVARRPSGQSGPVQSSPVRSGPVQ
jgi:formylglycine-generating enzyme required for sulfatase activity